MADDRPSLDILGIKPIADSVNTLTKGAVDGAAAFLGRICLPAAEEFGLMLRDRVHLWRVVNITALTSKAASKLHQQGLTGNLQAHPRLIGRIVEHGSWVDDPVVQDMWAGLLASSCTEHGDDDSNLVFVGLLSQLTRLQARVVNYACESANKALYPNGLIHAEDLTVTLDALAVVAGEHDIQRLDREVDYLRELGLLDALSGFQIGAATDLLLTPSPLALHLYVRAAGSRQSPGKFFGLPLVESDTV
ncbi:MAG: Abi-alpha family protein [Coriobacteriia bacterium]